MLVSLTKEQGAKINTLTRVRIIIAVTTHENH